MTFGSSPDTPFLRGPGGGYSNAPRGPIGVSGEDPPPGGFPPTPYNQLRSATRPEARAADLQLPEARQFAREARQGDTAEVDAWGQRMGPLATDSDPAWRKIGAAAPAYVDAVHQLSTDFAPVRDARQELLSARAAGTDPSDARQHLQAERRLALAGERRGLSQAELQAQRPRRYDRLLRRTGR